MNKLTSTRTHLPYDYYSQWSRAAAARSRAASRCGGAERGGGGWAFSETSLAGNGARSRAQKFCKPHGGVKKVAENLGELLSGDSIESSPYELYMKKDEFCKVLCEVNLDKKDVEHFKNMVKEDYHHNWIIDNLPAASVIDTDQFITTSYSRGFPIGYMDKLSKNPYLYNHVNIIIKYHQIDVDAFRVVGFYVEPFTVKHEYEDAETDLATDPQPALKTCDPNAAMELDSVKKEQPIERGRVIFTYDMLWKPSEIKWASRWDIYLSMDNAVPDKVHWFSIVNSLLIVLFLTGMIAMILVRNLTNDISRYNRVPTDEEKADDREETGWKLVHSDVFRPPTTLPMLLCVGVGTGVQLLAMSVVTIFFAAIGFLSPANRGSLLIAMLLLYVVMGAFAGYHSANLYKTFRGKQWQKVTLLTAFGYPSLCFVTFVALDIAEGFYGSSASVPALSIIALLALWFGISVPLVFLGAYIGFRKDTIEFPTKFSNIPKPVPDQPWYLGVTFTVLVGGVLPFGACFVELFFILSSMWMDQYYYVFGFLVLVFVILLATCAEITIVLLYFQLCAEDYHWWWRSFLTSGSTALYVLLYSAFYFSKLESNMYVTYVMYFGYMGIISIGLFLLTGTIGLFAALWFTKKIYGSIKVD